MQKDILRLSNSKREVTAARDNQSCEDTAAAAPKGREV